MKPITRSTVFRLILAVKMLPDFTAYWWLLPRRYKRIKTHSDYLRWLERKYWMNRFVEQYRHYCGFTEAMRWAGIAPITATEFRLPFQVQR